MKKTILITGGAGFLGSHVADELLRCGYNVRALDNLSLPAHGGSLTRPSYLNRDVDLVVGDIQNPEAVRRALQGVDAVCHLAAAVGASQSMYEIHRYAAINNVGTAVLMDAIVHNPVERLVVASSMCVYGEGLYRAEEGFPVQAGERSSQQLAYGDWDLRDAHGELLTPIPTPETKAPSLTSIYALSKFDQERTCQMIGKSCGISTVVLRIFNTYGPRQLVLSPYFGVIGVFASRIMNGNAPIVFEDGHQLRDFVSVYDVAAAFRLSLENDAASDGVFNIGSGVATTVRETAARLSVALGRPHTVPFIAGRHRACDVRHCFADVSLAKKILGFQPRITLDAGLAEIAEWLEQRVPYDKIACAFGTQRAVRECSFAERR